MSEQKWASARTLLLDLVCAEGVSAKDWARKVWGAAKQLEAELGIPMLEVLGRHLSGVRARLPGVFYGVEAVPQQESIDWFQMIQVKQESEGVCRLSRHSFLSKSHAEQVLAEELHARAAANDIWLGMEADEDLWRGQAQLVVDQLGQQVLEHNLHSVGTMVGQLLYGAVLVEWSAV